MNSLLAPEKAFVPSVKPQATPANGFVELAAKPAPATTVDHTQVVRFPLEPSWIWETHTKIEWCDISPLSAFGRGAVALGLRVKWRHDNTLRVWTNLEELAMLIAWSWSK